MVINKQFENEKELNDFLTTNKVRVINIMPKTVSTTGISASAVSIGGTYQQHQSKEVLDVWYEDSRKYLFTTMDGVQIFEGMKCWYYNQETPVGSNMLEYRHCNGKAIKGKYFGTKDAALKYIEENKPKVTRIVVEDKQRLEYQVGNKGIQLQFNTQTQEINVVCFDINNGNLNQIMVIPSSRNEITLCL